MIHKGLQAILLDPTNNERWLVAHPESKDRILVHEQGKGELSFADILYTREDPRGGIVIHAISGDRGVVITLGQIGPPDKPAEAMIGTWNGEKPAYQSANAPLNSTDPSAHSLVVEYHEHNGIIMDPNRTSK